MAITVNFNDLGLTLKDIPRFGVAGASLLNEHTHEHLQGLIISSQPFLSSKFLTIWFQQPQPYPSENELLGV